MRIGDEDVVVSFQDEEQADAFHQWMQTDGFLAFTKTHYNKDIDNPCEAMTDETDDFMHLEVE